MSETMLDLGEKAFIRRLLPKMEPHRDFVNGFGDDASVIDIGMPDVCMILKIDRAATPVAITKGWDDDYGLWGRVAVTSNCSDILAGGGTPKAVMLSLVLPGSWSAADAESVVLGCAAACRESDLAFAGGDTKEGESPQVVGCAVGLVPRAGILTRSGAAPGDILVMAGTVGGFVGSYLQLEFGDRITDPLAPRQDLLDYITRPTARWREASIMNSLRVARSAMDMSDGLFDVAKSLSQKQFGIELELDTMPFHPHSIIASRLFSIPLFNFAFGVGDWGIVYTVPKSSMGNVTAAAKEGGGTLARIGRVIEETGVFAVNGDGQRFRVDGVINEHFRIRMENPESFMERIQKDVTLLPV